jgi:putative Mn2+ efflux pump MntP
MLTIILTGIGLSMDAVAVSISSGMAVSPLRPAHALKMALSFGAFQAFMPAMGYACGLTVREWMSAIDHWIAFALLGWIGGHMLLATWQATPATDTPSNPFAFKTLLGLAVATSIDAWAVGLTFSLLEMPLVMVVTLIGAITFLLCYPAVWLGARLGAVASRSARGIGGLFLIGIGIHILIEHLS